MRCSHCFIFFYLLGGLVITSSLSRAEPEPFPKPAPNSADEPLAKTVSLAASARFLDAASVHWTQNRKCATCHTNVPYLLARPVLKDAPSKGMEIVRRFLENRVAHWDENKKGAKPYSATEVVVTAVAMAVNDARTTGKLHLLTRKALDRMWTSQRADGVWDWEKCSWPPMEHDDYFGAVFAAVGTAVAPGEYSRSASVQPGLNKLKKYLHETSVPNLHHGAWLLWASSKLDGLMTADERQRVIKKLVAIQRDDGGWSLPSLGDWKGFDGRQNDEKAPSDGYATGLVIYVLRQTGMSAKNESIRRGVHWLEMNQRKSGRWFTRSLNTDRAHYISNAGTAFAVLALTACAER